MASTGDLLSTGVSALQAFQRNLVTTGHNISNVNTEALVVRQLSLRRVIPLARVTVLLVQA